MSSLYSEDFPYSVYSIPGPPGVLAIFFVAHIVQIWSKLAGWFWHVVCSRYSIHPVCSTNSVYSGHCQFIPFQGRRACCGFWILSVFCVFWPFCCACIVGPRVIRSLWGCFRHSVHSRGSIHPVGFLCSVYSGHFQYSMYCVLFHALSAFGVFWYFLCVFRVFYMFCVFWSFSIFHVSHSRDRVHSVCSKCPPIHHHHLPWVISHNLWFPVKRVIDVTTVLVCFLS